MPEPELRRLILAIRSATGIEARVWLTDIAGLSSDDATDLMRCVSPAMYQVPQLLSTGGAQPAIVKCRDRSRSPRKDEAQYLTVRWLWTTARPLLVT